MKRLLALVGVLLMLAGCVEVDQVLELRADGGVKLNWRLGLFTALARGPWARPDEERAAELAAMVPPEATAFVKTRVDSNPQRIWLVVEAELPDVTTYARFREAFIAAFEGDNDPVPMIYPPVVQRWMGRWYVTVDVPARLEDDGGPPKGDASARWKLRVDAPGQPISSNADRIDADGALVWDTSMGAVVHQGVRARAILPIPGMWAWWAGGAAAMGVVAGGGALIARRRFA
jgi:hypothetical protein